MRAALLLLVACAGDPGSTAPDPEDSTPPGTEPIGTPWVPFEAGLNLLVEGDLVPAGGDVYLGGAPVGFAPVTRAIHLSNASAEAVDLAGDPAEWISGDGSIRWDEPPPARVEAGGVVRAVLAMDPLVVGAAAASMELPTGARWDLWGTVEQAATVVIVGRLGRTLVSDDYGATFGHDVQEVTDPYADEWRNDANFRDITYANGQFVAVGGDAERRFSISPDGRAWTDVNTGYSGSVDTVDYGLGLYFATDDGDILWSVTGAHWIEESGGWRPSLSAVAFGNDRFVGVGSSRRAVSLDGMSWHVDVDSGAELWAVAFGNGVFVAVGPSGHVAWSTDGEAWSEQTIGTANRGEVAFGNGSFAIGGWPDATWTSNDGQTWTERAGAEQLGPMGFANGLFFGSSWRDRIWSSPDAATWTLVVDDSSPERAGYTGMAFAQEPAD